MIKIIRTSTIAVSLDILLRGQLKFLSRNFNVLAVSGQDEHLNNLKSREGVGIRNVPMQRQISPLKDFISLCKLIVLFIKEKPVLVHSITPKAGLLTMLAAKITGVPIRIHTFTGLVFPSKAGLFQKLLIKMDQLLCWAATNIYPEGLGVKDDLSRFSITDKPLKILANGNVNGIDLDHFCQTQIGDDEKERLKKALGISDSDFLFIFVGRLVRDKGINELIEAFSSLNIPKTKLLLVGDLESELDPLLPETLQMIGRNNNIISVGFQKDVRPYFAISHLLAFPSYREGFPNVVMQAGAMELPCIVTNINGSNEIIVEGVNGVIIPSRDVDSLKASMLLMVNDKQNYELLKSNARFMISSRYDRKLVWNSLLEEYQSLIDEKQR